MTLEQYLWRHHDDEMTDLVLAVMTSRFRPAVLADWWADMVDRPAPITSMRAGVVSSTALVDMAMEASSTTRAGWPEKVQIAADALRAAANEARERGAA